MTAADTATDAIGQALDAGRVQCLPKPLRAHPGEDHLRDEQGAHGAEEGPSDDGGRPRDQDPGGQEQCPCPTTSAVLARISDGTLAS
jgi:hypothetical protein